jgi:hypothetical protein
VFVNTDQIVTVGAGQNVTELQMVDGRTRWVRDTPEEVVSLAKAFVRAETSKLIARGESLDSGTKRDGNVTGERLLL